MMSPTSTKPGKAVAAQGRRTVRIVKSRTLSRPALISLVVACAAVVATLALWRFWQPKDIVPPAQRTLGEWETDWKCDSGHSFHAAGQTEPRSCWTCGKPAYPVAYYHCPTHGTYETNARFKADDEGRPKVAYLRLRGGSWVSVEQGLRCPRCGQLLRYGGHDPLRGLGNRETPGGG
jgi:hypothetical protein